MAAELPFLFHNSTGPRYCGRADLPRACCMQDGSKAEAGAGAALVERLFGVGLHTRLVCEESREAAEEGSTAYQLKCNISLEVNHLSEGIRLGLQDDREKNSEALGRLALFKV